MDKKSDNLQIVGNPPLPFLKGEYTKEPEFKLGEFNEQVVRTGVKFILQGLGLNLEDQNLVDTPARVSRGYREICRGLYDQEKVLNSFQKAIFDSKNDEMVIMKGIQVFSLCPHHLLPVKIDATVAYIPKGKVVGLSKLARIVEIVFAQPALQEDATVMIADILMDKLSADGAGVYVVGEHMCMQCRGVKKTEAVTITSAVRGSFKDDAKTRDEFLSIVRGR